MSLGIFKRNKEKMMTQRDNEMNSLFESFFGFDPNKSWLSNNYNLLEEDDKYEVKIQLPGVKKEEIELSFKDDMLNVEWKHESKHESNSGRQSFYLAGANVDDINAKLENGILTVEVLKTNEAKTKIISIN